MSTNLENGARERQRKRESRRQTNETQRKKGDRDLEREINNKGDIFCWKNNDNFEAAVTKKRNASGHQCKLKMSGSEKKM